jgi:hypothetical protein
MHKQKPFELPFHIHVSDLLFCCYIHTEFDISPFVYLDMIQQHQREDDETTTTTTTSKKTKALLCFAIYTHSIGSIQTFHVCF